MRTNHCTYILLPTTGSSLMDNEPQLGQRIVYKKVSVGVRQIVRSELREELPTFMGEDLTVVDTD